MEPTKNEALLNLGADSALAAIVFTDVENFTSKMAADQAHTLALTNRDLQLMTEFCQRFQGRVVADTGDGLFMCFASAVNAVACALEIQKAFFVAAAELPPQDVLKHRIGIHLGDVACVGTQVKGHGVNMAARLQVAAKPGGICISQTVYDVVKNHLPLPGMYKEVRELKGIAESTLVYQIPPLCKPKRVFMSYRSSDPDVILAQQFYEALKAAGHEAFMAGHSIRLGEGWPARIDTELKQCDYLLLLLSEQSVTSEMVTEEVRRAKELRDASPDGKPAILPIRVKFPLTSPLNYNLRGYLNRIQQREWRSPADTSTMVQEILSLVGEGRVPEESPETVQSTPPALCGLDGKPVPMAVPELPQIPELPEGQVDLASAFYVERPPLESRCYETILQPGSLIRIKAPRQMGKTSLMARILHHASKSGFQTVPLSFQLADGKVFADLDKFLKWFCASVCRRLRLPNRLNDYWDDIFGSKDNCTAYFEEYLLENIESPLALGLDEVDYVFQHPEIAADFFGLLRAWHEDAKNRDIWKKLRLVVVHSTEVYIPLSINQSPFNVGLPIELPEFTPQQVYDLTRWHDLDWNITQVEKLMAMVGGHPYLVRLALYYISRQDMTLEQLLQTSPTEAGLYGDHLRRHLWNLQQHPELARAMTEVVAATAPVRLESVQGFKLHSMGLVHLQGNEVTPCCDLYRFYFCDRLLN
ncbi:AAA-like domain-containing protein [Argonema antarcticum]|uniref:AAA-like domain-containing protein n=1 Tax=Argonema antarcticum TaxID=2942763 RepID=UPI002011CC1C|nr:AAA-like domain-containing protein [Argonema antarcticum]MCL1474916.1 AAA-like domain-containing protein [Argonema antarcticum A004/B2]